MSNRNIAISVLAIIALVAVLAHGLKHAWITMGAYPFGFILLTFIVVAWIWGRLSR